MDLQVFINKTESENIETDQIHYKNINGFEILINQLNEKLQNRTIGAEKIQIGIKDCLMAINAIKQGENLSYFDVFGIDISTEERSKLLIEQRKYRYEEYLKKLKENQPIFQGLLKEFEAKKELLNIRNEALKNQAKKESNGSKVNIVFENIFKNPDNAEICLNILRELDPPFIDSENNFKGKNKAIIAVWIRALEKHNPPIINYYSDLKYSKLLNIKIKGLNLTNDATEFRKSYMRAEASLIQIKAKLSELSHSGKLGS